jgi:hypothetical protein
VITGGSTSSFAKRSEMSLAVTHLRCFNAGSLRMTGVKSQSLARVASLMILIAGPRTRKSRKSRSASAKL